jgi:hypothetical protein
VTDAIARNAISLKQVEREDEFFADLQAERDRETADLYEGGIQEKAIMNTADKPSSTKSKPKSREQSL